MSGTHRFREQRQRLVDATGLASALGRRSVSAVVALTGVGRATFYECFDDFEHAEACARAESARRVSSALILGDGEAWAQAERGGEAAGVSLEALCERWTALCGEEPSVVLCALAAEETVRCFVHCASVCRGRDAGQSDSRTELAEVGVREVGVREVGVREVGVREVGVREVGVREVGVREVGVRAELTIGACAVAVAREVATRALIAEYGPLQSGNVGDVGSTGSSEFRGERPFLGLVPRDPREAAHALAAAVRASWAAPD